MQKRITFELDDRLEPLLKKQKKNRSKIELDGVFGERVTNIIAWGDADDLTDAIIQGLWLLSEKSHSKHCKPIPNLEACTSV